MNVLYIGVNRTDEEATLSDFPECNERSVQCSEIRLCTQ